MRSIRAPCGCASLLAGIFHAARRIDLADHVPVFLVGDRNELVLTLELGLQRGTLPGEREEGLLDLCLERRIEIVRQAVAGGWEGLGLVDRTDLGLVHDV